MGVDIHPVILLTGDVTAVALGVHLVDFFPCAAAANSHAPGRCSGIAHDSGNNGAGEIRQALLELADRAGEVTGQSDGDTMVVNLRSGVRQPQSRCQSRIVAEGGVQVQGQVGGIYS